MSDLAERLATRCAGDGEFRMFARYWTGSLAFDLGFDRAALALDNGAVAAAPSATGEGEGHLSFRGPPELWRLILQPVPPPFHNDLMPALGLGLLQDGPAETFWQYYPAARRAVELLRELV